VESVKTLLSRSSHSALGRVAEHRQSQSDWRKWLGSKLPAELGTRMTGVVERDGNLVIFAESAAWSARLRFAIAELDAEIRSENPAIRGVAVKVLPRS
jgi:predicted nucleic acid-binding Zn ribbon protein